MPVDYGQYHPKWKLISHLIRFRRAGGRCERCGVAHGSVIGTTPSGKERKVSLATHHKDGNRANNRFWNLEALCQKCHIVADKPKQAYSRRYGRETAYLVGRLF